MSLVKLLFKYNSITLSLLLLLGACDTVSLTRDLRKSTLKGKVERTIELIDLKEQYTYFDQGLAMLERGLAKHLLGNFIESNQELELVTNYINETQAIRISEEATETFVTGEAGDYQFYPYEMLLVSYYKIINYMALGKLSAANVEAEQIDTLLKTYDFDVLRADSRVFFRVISAIVYAANYNWQDAVDSVRVAQKLAGQIKSAIPDRVKAILECSNIGNARECPEFFGKGQVAFVIFEMDFVNLPQEYKIDVPSDDSDITIALPQYSVINDARGSLDSGKILDVNQMAQDALAARLPKLTAEAVARKLSTKKSNSANIDTTDQNEEAAKKEGNVIGFFFRFISAKFESADLRSWTLLPARLLLFSEVITDNNIDGIAIPDNCRKSFSKEKNQNPSKIYLLSSRCF